MKSISKYDQTYISIHFLKSNHMKTNSQECSWSYVAHSKDVVIYEYVIIWWRHAVLYNTLHQPTSPPPHTTLNSASPYHHHTTLNSTSPPHHHTPQSVVAERPSLQYRSWATGGVLTYHGVAYCVVLYHTLGTILIGIQYKRNHKSFKKTAFSINERKFISDWQ